jgi:hypothetical protein
MQPVLLVLQIAQSDEDGGNDEEVADVGARLARASSGVAVVPAARILHVAAVVNPLLLLLSSQSTPSKNKSILT